ncbi:MAG TPA: M56 family metallopeptidase [Candidatus Baltobacteraceae bacterium]|nr:M56 family metallopeptidase [Candidatus Baltobacteraceae bacterium]
MNASPILTALFNGAWQGALLCTLAMFAFRLFRRLNATTMFTVWSVLLAIAVLLPFANYAFAAKPVQVTVPLVQARAVEALPVRYAVAPEPVKPAFDARAGAMNAADAVFRDAFWILLVLAAIALVRVAILGRDVIRMLVARTRVRPIEPPVALGGAIARPYRYAASDEFTSPCVLGFAPALIVIPQDLLAHPGTELTSVVLHEREHVRRFDDVQNVIQRFIGAVAFFCPGVRIALRELALYREQICDDAAVNATGDRVSYAMTLTDLAQWAQGRGAPVPSLIFKRKHLLHRLEVLLDSAVSHSMRMNRRFALGAAAALVLAAAVVLRFQVPVIAETFEAPPHVKHHVAVIRKTIATAVSTPKREAARAPQVQRAPAAHRETFALRAPPVATVAAAAANAISSEVAAVAAVAPAAPMIVQAHQNMSGSLLDALNDAGMRNLPVDQLIALRDHGVSAVLVQSATSYFGHVTAPDLTFLADHGVGPRYIDVLRMGGITGISPADAVQMMDHGVSSSLIRSALGYFDQRPGPADLIFMADHGIGAPFIDSLRANGVKACRQDAVRMLDHGVDAAYAAKIRRSNPRASVSDIIRLHDAGF